MPDATENGQRATRIRELDGLRGVAIMLVITLHIAIRPFFQELTELLGKPAARLLDMGWCGVDIFFVLSGFLIGGIILDHLDSEKFYSTFYSRRVGRIFPLYFLIVSIAFIAKSFGISDHQNAVPLVAYLTFTANVFTSAGFFCTFMLGPLWSICIEEQFYILAPMAIRNTSRWALPFSVTCVVIVSATLRIACMIGWIKTDFSCWDLTFSRLDGLGIGVLTASLLRRASFVEWVKANGHSLKLILITLCFICIWFSQQPNALLLGWGIFFVSLTSAAAIVVLIFYPKGLFGYTMRLQFLVSLGKYSYFLYLFHMLFEGATRIGIQSANVTNLAIILALKLCAMILLFFIAMVSWRYVEKPIIQRVHRGQY